MAVMQPGDRELPSDITGWLDKQHVDRHPGGRQAGDKGDVQLEADSHQLYVYLG